ncbi:MAG: SMI1/KNR4 family protein [Micrococcaceae bacterium]
MLSREALSEKFVLDSSASDADIRREEADYGGPLPVEFLELLRLSDGLTAAIGSLSLLNIDGVVQRNREYEIQLNFPDYFMIGDDGGGQAILLNLNDRRIYEVGMGTPFEEDIEFSADSLHHLLELGTSLNERRTQ